MSGEIQERMTDKEITHFKLMYHWFQKTILSEEWQVVDYRYSNTSKYNVHSYIPMI